MYTYFRYHLFTKVGFHPTQNTVMQLKLKTIVSIKPYLLIQKKCFELPNEASFQGQQNELSITKTVGLRVIHVIFPWQCGNHFI